VSWGNLGVTAANDNQNKFKVLGLSQTLSELSINKFRINIYSNLGPQKNKKNPLKIFSSQNPKGEIFQKWKCKGKWCSNPYKLKSMQKKQESSIRMKKNGSFPFKSVTIWSLKEEKKNQIFEVMKWKKGQTRAYLKLILNLFPWVLEFRWRNGEIFQKGKFLRWWREAEQVGQPIGEACRKGWVVVKVGFLEKPCVHFEVLKSHHIILSW